MINYTEKGFGLHAAIETAGHVLREENGVWISSNDAAVQAIIDAYAISDAVQSVNDRIDAFAKVLRDKFVKAISPAEMASWTIKYNEAKAFQASGLASDAPTLQSEAGFRGVTIAGLATRVIANYNIMTARETKIAGNAGKHKDAVKALGSFAAVNGYDWQTPMSAV